ncbi:MAG: GntR family transcriptional regulator [Ideonella sp.]
MARKSALTEVSQRGVAASTRATAVYERLRSDIAHGELEPGSKLRVEAMCARYNVGASPLREALSRLSSEGLVARTDLRGFSVAPLNWDELPVLTNNRVQLESIALRESIANRDRALEDQLVLLVHRLSRTPRSLAEDHYVSNPEWETVHRDFHDALLSRCPSRWLRAFCEKLTDENYRFRQMAADQGRTMRNEHDEHVAIFEAVIEGRADDAVRALESHYRRTAEIVGAVVSTKTPIAVSKAA